jgi:uncharacterized protein YejL (UPF0352 family)
MAEWKSVSFEDGVDTKIATHTAVAAAHHVKYTDAEAVTAMGAIGDANPLHHNRTVKYTDAEVDAIVAVHTAIASAHHSKYTDAEVDAIVLTHKNIAGAHHSKYTDAEAVSAVATSDDYVKTIGDTMTGDLNLNGNVAVKFDHSKLYEKSYDTGWVQCGLTPAAGDRDIVLIFMPSGTATNSVMEMYNNSDGTAAHRGIVKMTANEMLIGGEAGNYPIKFIQNGVIKIEMNTTNLDLKNLPIKDIKNHVASALSGTKKLVEIDIGGTPYYYEVYPTKA